MIPVARGAEIIEGPLGCDEVGKSMLEYHEMAFTWLQTLSQQLKVDDNKYLNLQHVSELGPDGLDESEDWVNITLHPLLGGLLKDSMDNIAYNLSPKESFFDKKTKNEIMVSGMNLSIPSSPSSTHHSLNKFSQLLIQPILLL